MGQQRRASSLTADCSCTPPATSNGAVSFHSSACSDSDGGHSDQSNSPQPHRPHSVPPCTPLLLPPQPPPVRSVSASSSASFLSSASSHLSLSESSSEVSSEWPQLGALCAVKKLRPLSAVEEAAMIEERHLFAPSPSASNSYQSVVSHFHSGTADGQARKRQQAHTRRTAELYEEDVTSVHDERVEQQQFGTPNTAMSRASTSRAAGLSVDRLLLQLSAPTHRWQKGVRGRHCPTFTLSSLVRACMLCSSVAMLAFVLCAAWWAGVLPYRRAPSVQVSLPIDLSTVASSSGTLWAAAHSSTRPSSSLPVHVIASCANRYASLRSCLPTWLSVPEVSSVTLVDWGSDEPLQDRLREHVDASNGRLRVVTLDEPLPWMLSTSVNLALHFLPLHTPSLLLKLDCDTLLQPQFVAQHPLEEGDFYAGDWRKARDENEMHLNGVIYLRLLSLLRVNGYDERLQSYGYDDTNLHERLTATNLTARPLRFQYISHLKHDDSLRRGRLVARTDDSQQQRKLQQQQRSEGNIASAMTVASFSSSTALSVEQLVDIAAPFFATQLHRVLLDVVPRWNASMSGAAFRITAGAQPHTYRARLEQLPARLEDSVSREQWLKAVREAAEITLRRVGLAIDRLPPTEDLHGRAHYLMRLVGFWTTDSEKKPLVVHVQHGLSNRLRAVASAAAVAAATGMPLKVIWLSDHHCAARFSDLFRVRGELSDPSLLHTLSESALSSVAQLRSQDVWENSAELPGAELLSRDVFDVYNYMEPEEGAWKSQPVEVLDGIGRRGVYIKSAYRLMHDAGLRDDNLNHALSSLVLSAPVMALVYPLLRTSSGDDGELASVDAGSLRAPMLDAVVGVHVRHRPPRNEVAGLLANEYTDAGWAALVAARQLSSAEVYIRAMREAATKPEQRFYVSSDDPSIVAEMESAFGSDRILRLSQDACANRSVQCTQRALADQLLLGQTSRLLGSVWSSYSEVAALWRLRAVSYPPEVSDIVERTYAEIAEMEGDTSSRLEEQQAALQGGRPILLTPELLTAEFTDPSIAAFALLPTVRTSTCRIELFSPLGERCSGTSYVQELLLANFNATSTDAWHSPHFFGVERVEQPYEQAGCVLFVGVVRAPLPWLECFYRQQPQLDQWRYTSWHDFLTHPIVSYAEPHMNRTLSALPASERAAARQRMLQQPVAFDRNFEQAQLREWRNIFELRRLKADFMLETFPLLAANYVLIRLEDLHAHAARFLHILQLWFNLQPNARSNRHALTAQQLAHLTARTPMPEYAGAALDAEVSDEQGRLIEGHTLPEEVRESAQKGFEWGQEARFGYGVTSEVSTS